MQKSIDFGTIAYLKQTISHTKTGKGKVFYLDKEIFNVSGAFASYVISNFHFLAGLRFQ